MGKNNSGYLSIYNNLSSLKPPNILYVAVAFRTIGFRKNHILFFKKTFGF